MNDIMSEIVAILGLLMFWVGLRRSNSADEIFDHATELLKCASDKCDSAKRDRLDTIKMNKEIVEILAGEKA